jgi:hypothetical protein
MAIGQEATMMGLRAQTIGTATGVACGLDVSAA